ncbi:hypothetical protein [Alistipes finegoldii]
MQPPPTLKNTEKNRCGTKKTAERKREPPKKKKVCWREEEETATERERLPKGKREPQKKKESLLAGRRGNSNGTKKATGEKKENRRKTRKPAGEKAEPSWAAKRVQKKAGGNPFPNYQKEQKRPFRGLVGAGKFYYLYVVLPKPFRYGPNIRYIPDRHGAAGLGGLRCPAFF